LYLRFTHACTPYLITLLKCFIWLVSLVSSPHLPTLVSLSLPTYPIICTIHLWFHRFSDVNFGESSTSNHHTKVSKVLTYYSSFLFHTIPHHINTNLSLYYLFLGLIFFNSSVCKKSYPLYLTLLVTQPFTVIFCHYFLSFELCQHRKSSITVDLSLRLTLDACNYFL